MSNSIVPPVAPVTPAAPAKPAAPTPAAPATPANPKAAAAAAPAAATPEIPALGADAPDAPETPETPGLGADAGDAEDNGNEGAADTEGAESEGDEGDAELAYEFEAPEGEPAYRPAVIDAYKAVLTKHKIDPAIAQDILQSVMPVIRSEADAAAKEHFDTTTSEWREELHKQHGAKLPDVMKLVNRGLAKAASPELRKFLGESALAVNPEFINMLAWFSQRVTNDRTVKSTESPPSKELSATEELALEYDREAAKERG